MVSGNLRRIMSTPPSFPCTRMVSPVAAQRPSPVKIYPRISRPPKPTPPFPMSTCRPFTTGIPSPGARSGILYMSKTTPCSIQWITGFLLAAAMLPPGAAQENNPGISLGELQHEAATIEQRLQRQEDINAIENLQRSYGYFYDKALWREAADLFSADGSIEIADHGNFIGRERVLAYLQSLGQEGPQYGRLLDHLLLQPVITVAEDGGTARGRWHLLSQGGSLTPADDPGRAAAAAKDNQPFGYV